MLAHLLAVVLAQAGEPSAQAVTVSAAPWWAQLLNGVSLVTFLTMIWFVATYKATLDRIIRITGANLEKHLGNRVEKLEETVNGDGKSNPGCPMKHQEIEARLAKVPSRDSLSEAFTQIKQLTQTLSDTAEAMKLQASEDRRAVEVVIEHLYGVTRQLDERVRRLMGEDPGDATGDRPHPGVVPSPMKRSTTNPHMDVPAGVFSKKKP